MIREWKKESYRIILLLLGVLSAVCGFLSAFATTINGLDSYTAVLLVTALTGSCALFVIHYMENTVVSKRIRIVTGCIIVFVCIFSFSLLQLSFFGLVNEMKIGIQFDGVLDAEGFLLLGTLILCFINGELLYKRRNIAAVIIDGAILFSPMLFGRMPSTFYMTLFLVFLAGFFSIKGKASSKTNVLIPIETMLAVTIICIFVNVIFPQKSFQQWKVFENVRARFITAFENDELPATEHVMTNGGVNGGKVGNIDEISYSNQTMLVLRSGITGSVYLKGFTGNVFENNQWRDYNNNEYSTEQTDYKEMFEKLAEDGIDPARQTAILLTAMEHSQETYQMLNYDLSDYLGRIIRRRYTVIYEGAQTVFSYIPYGSLYSIQKKSAYDGYFLNSKESISTYGYVVNANDYDFWKELSETYEGDNQYLNEYFAWEKLYREYVYDRNTVISAEQKNTIDNAKNPVPVYAGDGTMQQVLNYTEEIKKYFAEHYTYTLAPGQVPEGKDVFQYFLNENPNGYCSYFATSAALIFKNAGIPCRYVEGYAAFVSEEMAAASEEVTESRNSSAFSATDTYTSYTIDVTDTSAHAWVEIYMDGYGWIPIDVTPGYQNRQDTQYYQQQENSVNVDILREHSLEEEIEEEPLQDIEDEEQNLEPPPSHIKDRYDSIAEYMKDNTTKRIDFKIVMPIIGRYLLRLFLIALCILAVLALVALGFIVPAVIGIRRMKKNFILHENQTPQEDMLQILAIYAYIEKLGRFLKCSRRIDESYDDFSNRLKECKDYFETAQVDEIIKSVQKVSFGRGNIGKKEMESALTAVGKISELSYKELGKIRKILYRYVWHLG